MNKRFTLFILAVLVASMALSACQPAAPAAEEAQVEEAAAEKVEEEKVDEAAMEDVTLNIMMEGVPDTEYVQALLPQFEEETGIKVNIEVLNYALMHEKLVPQLTASEGDGSYDIIVVDNYWVGEFTGAGWLIPLDDFVNSSDVVDMDAYLPSMVEMVGVQNGTTYMLPFYNYAMALIYREDLLNDADLQAEYKAEFGKDLAIPDNMADYVELAKFMTRDTDGDGEVDIYGASMQGLRPDPTAMEWLNYLYGLGGLLYDADGNTVVDSPAGVEALTLYKDAMENAAPPGAPAYGFDEAFSVMAQGKAFSFITYNWMLPVLNDPEQSEVVDKVAVTQVPGGIGLLGGWGWAIPVSSPNYEAAWKFIEWVESYDVAKERALMGGAPSRADVFQDADVLAKYSYYSEVEKIVGEAIMFPNMSRSPQIVEVLGRVISEVVTGSKEPADGIKELGEELAKLTD